MKFDTPLKDILSKTNFENPPAGPYVLRCLDAKETVSKKGNAMIEFSFDIAEGPFLGAYKDYPIKYYLVHKKSNYGIEKGILKSFQKSNPEFIKEEALEGNEFDESLLIGCKIGSLLREEEYMSKKGQVRSNLKILFLTSLGSLKEKNFQAPEKLTLEDQLNFKNKQNESFIEGPVKDEVEIDL